MKSGRFWPFIKKLSHDIEKTILCNFLFWCSDFYYSGIFSVMWHTKVCNVRHRIIIVKMFGAHPVCRNLLLSSLLAHLSLFNIGANKYGGVESEDFISRYPRGIIPGYPNIWLPLPVIERLDQEGMEQYSRSIEDKEGRSRILKRDQGVEKSYIRLLWRFRREKHKREPWM